MKLRQALVYKLSIYTLRKADACLYRGMHKNEAFGPELNVRIFSKIRFSPL